MRRQFTLVAEPQTGGEVEVWLLMNANGAVIAGINTPINTPVEDALRDLAETWRD